MLGEGALSGTRVQNRLRQVGNDVRHERLLCGEAGILSHAGGRANLFPAEIMRILVPRPLGGEGGLQPAFSSAGAGRVRGSKTLGPSETMPEVFVHTSAFCILRFDLFLWLRHDVSILVKTPSPPRASALWSPLSPKGARENESLVWRRIRDRVRAQPCSPRDASANLDSCAGGQPASPGTFDDGISGE